MNDYTDMYYEKFGKGFPLMQAQNREKAIEHIRACIIQGKLAEEVYPEIYGALPSKFV